MTTGTTSRTQVRWVFGYGSLIWNPGFQFVEQQQALLNGAHRSLCIHSHRHRGTVEQPGLVFGLARGGSCRGMAFAVADDDWAEVREYLREREQVTGVYREAWRPLRLADGNTVEGLAFLVDVKHEQYAGRLPLESQLKIVSGAIGASGPNVDYVLNTAEHLRALGIADKRVQDLARMLEGQPGNRLTAAL
ncbi:gamma-glutamylcyclotransferase [Devosia pacifica]|uniref:glutathione-specific gamma-glutamylcyclotransferase n=1 Tax=Devosia pacifica TaxID=1335967 RepID=A0A918S8C9_9HYPH|nr:gamma-glutamylcyclotransferase [Devosia pacifica]GHA26018.1 gamma-glutamylcyclotransferase [Devosia pacifica]